MSHSIEEIDTDDTYVGSKFKEEDQDETVEMITATTIAQKKMEDSITYKLSLQDTTNIIDKNKIIKFLRNGIEQIPTSHQGLDSSKVWISFWILNGMDMVDSLDSYPAISSRTSSYFKILQNDDTGYEQGVTGNFGGGGFGGGNSHTSHSVSTFAAISTLYAVGTEECYKTVDRESMYRFLMRMKTKDGAFTSEDGGEYDSRTTYCAIAVAAMLNILTPELERGVVDYLVSCQTYEGGFGAYPGNEGHGGYTFCAVAALSILNSLHKIDMNSLHRWITFRQSEDGGFEGRTNKLVDTCYSYWQGAVFIIIQSYYQYYKDTNSNEEGLLFNQSKLQEYIIKCCQQTDKRYSGFSDHPHRGRDYYHTCYGLSGISLSQHNHIGKIIDTMNTKTQDHPIPPITNLENTFSISNNNDNNSNGTDQMIDPIHPIYNLKVTKVEKGLKYFYSLNSINHSTVINHQNNDKK